MSIALRRHAFAGVVGVVALAVAAAALLLSAGSAGANNSSGGITGPAFFVDGERYRTVLTQTDLLDTGAPDGSFDIIYDLGGAQPNVAEAAPGDADYNGGRWQVHAVSFNSSYAETLAAHDLDDSGFLDSAEEIESALDDGSSSGATDLGVVKSFVCPVIPMPRS